MWNTIRFNNNDNFKDRKSWEIEHFNLLLYISPAYHKSKTAIHHICRQIAVHIYHYLGFLFYFIRIWNKNIDQRKDKQNPDIPDVRNKIHGRNRNSIYRCISKSSGAEKLCAIRNYSLEDTGENIKQ